MRVELLKEERDVLLAHPETEVLVRPLLERSIPSALSGTAEDMDLLRDACAELLQGIGFDENYVPTREGVLLESLIDKLLVLDC